MTLAMCPHTKMCDHAHQALRVQEFQMSPTSLSLMLSLASPAPGYSVPQQSVLGTPSIQTREPMLIKPLHPPLSILLSPPVPKDWPLGWHNYPGAAVLYKPPWWGLQPGTTGGGAIKEDREVTKIPTWKKAFYVPPPAKVSPRSPSQHALGLWLGNCVFSLTWCHLRLCDTVASRRGLQSRLLTFLLYHSPTMTLKKWLQSLNSLFEKKKKMRLPT